MTDGLKDVPDIILIPKERASQQLAHLRKLIDGKIGVERLPMSRGDDLPAGERDIEICPNCGEEGYLVESYGVIACEACFGESAFDGDDGSGDSACT
jgi:hypothetical protein